MYLVKIYNLPLNEYEHKLPHSPALHVVEVDKQETQPDPSGDVALKQETDSSHRNAHSGPGA